MNASDITRLRLWRQQIARPRFKKPGEVVAALGAMQAQDYLGAKWSIGLRLPDAKERDIDEAIARREIVRTWPMRGTLHFVAATDVRWMLKLLTPRIVAGAEKRRLEYGLDPAVLSKCENIFVKALQGGRPLTRDVLHDLLEKGNVPITPQRSYHIFWKHAQEGIICFGAHEGKQATFTLLDEWIPKSRRLEGDAALAELARRYFTGHGPATLRDLVWWSGLRVSDARKALDFVATDLHSETFDGATYWMSPELPMDDKPASDAYLLSGFDEYMLGYTDRSAALDPKFAARICPGSNGVFSPTIVVKGRVVGTWKRTEKKGEAVITPKAFTSLTKAEIKALAAPAERYGKYLGVKAKVAA